MPPALAIGASNLRPPVGQKATSAQARPRPSEPPEPGAAPDAAIACGTRSPPALETLEPWEVMPGRGCSCDCGSDGGGREGGGRAAAASPRGLYKASLITAAWSLLASTHLPLTLIKFWVAPSYGSFCCILTSPSS